MSLSLYRTGQSEALQTRGHKQKRGTLSIQLGCFGGAF